MYNEELMHFQCSMCGQNVNKMSENYSAYEIYTSTGFRAYQFCSRCNRLIIQAIDKTAENMKEYEKKKKADVEEAIKEMRERRKNEANI